MKGNTVNDMLSKGELEVFNYIKEQTADGSPLRESMKSIGAKLDTSEATVCRATAKLKKAGIIGIDASQEKAESNSIVFFGEPDVEEETNEIFNMIAELNQRANRFKTLLEQKDIEIERLQSQLNAANKKLGEQVKPVEDSGVSIETKTGKVITAADIISVTDLGGGTVAYITKVQ